jgi:hypothetical protein
MHNEPVSILKLVKNTQANELSVKQQLIDAKKEIDDLKLQIKWLERLYE